MGVAISFALYFGARISLGLYIGAFCSLYYNLGPVNEQRQFLTDIAPLFILSLGVVLQALIPVWVIRRYNLFDHDFSDPKKTSLFFIVIGPFGGLIKATSSISVYYILNMHNSYRLFEEWLFWWASDSCFTILVVTSVLVFTKFNKLRQKVISIVLVSSLLAAFGMFYFGQKWEEERLDLLFEQKVASAIDTLDHIRIAHIQLMNNVKGFKGFRDTFTKEEFTIFATTNLNENEYVRSIAWEEVIPHSERVEFEKEMISLHGEDVFLWEFGDNLEQVEAFDTDEYIVVKLLEPSQYSYAIGHVVGADIKRNIAIGIAREQQILSLTAPVILIVEPRYPSAATIYQAHFNGDELAGYTALLIRIDEMVNSLIDKSGEDDFYIGLHDKEAGKDLSFLSYDKETTDLSGLKSEIVEFPILNRTWVLEFTRTPEFIKQNETSLPRFIGTLGTLFAALIVIINVILSGQSIYLEKQVRQRTKELEKANRIKSEFMANMSHDLRTPLNAIIGFSQMMIQEIFGKMGSKKYNEYAKDINDSSGYLLSLINDVLDFSALDADKRALDKEPCDAHVLIDDCIRSLKPLSDEKQLKIKSNIKDDFPELFADVRAMKQIFINLISNSIKFTPAGGAIIIDGKIVKGNFVFTVTDTGIGIDQMSIQNILHPFIRVENNPHISQEGTGLGLSIVHSLVKLHEGVLSIESEVGKGTVVTVKLPRQS